MDIHFHLSVNVVERIRKTGINARYNGISPLDVPAYRYIGAEMLSYATSLQQIRIP